MYTAVLSRLVDGICLVSNQLSILLLKERALVTGRVVPESVLEAAIEQVPKSVKILAPLVDYFVELLNDSNTPDIELVTEGETWESFASKWVQYVINKLRAML
jgi:hypothetical protein